MTSANYDSCLLSRQTLNCKCEPQLGLVLHSLSQWLLKAASACQLPDFTFNNLLMLYLLYSPTIFLTLALLLLAVNIVVVIVAIGDICCCSKQSSHVWDR